MYELCQYGSDWTKKMTEPPFNSGKVISGVTWRASAMARFPSRLFDLQQQQAIVPPVLIATVSPESRTHWSKFHVKLNDNVRSFPRRILNTRGHPVWLVNVLLFGIQSRSPWARTSRAILQMSFSQSDINMVQTNFRSHEMRTQQVKEYLDLIGLRKLPSLFNKRLGNSVRKSFPSQ